ncbi:MAG: glycosyltransferase [Bacteroidales bacterium]|nr:glycosyltransferase [Bacteroidales bacterium]
MPLFSLVIPVYNVAPYLADCLASVARQDFGDWEAVCIDDGSTDGSGSLLDDYSRLDVRFRVSHQANRGLSAARNAGLAMARGEYVLFLDSDDTLEPNALGSLAGQVDGEDLVCFGGWRGEEREVPAAAHYPSGWDYYNQHALEPRVFPFVCVVLRCYRRQFLLDSGLRFREGILHEDNHFTPRVCLAAGRVRAVGLALYHYRLREGSIMHTRSLRSRRDLIAIANDLSAHFMQYSVDNSVIYRALTHHYQAAFADATRDEDVQLLPLVDWHLYHTVSRTRLRHRVNYLALRTSPALFRLILRLG